ncbi:MAG: carbonic anhydrase [bacterium]
MGSQRFATAITCLDGRVQRPVVDHLRRRYGFDYVDLVTVPGPEQALTEIAGLRGVAYVRRNLAFSIETHASGLVALAAHDGCAANDADPDTRRAQFNEALELVRDWSGGVQVLGLWVDEAGNVKEIAGTDLAPIPIPSAERAPEPSVAPAPVKARTPRPADSGDRAFLAGVAGFFIGLAAARRRSK